MVKHSYSKKRRKKPRILLILFIILFITGIIGFIFSVSKKFNNPILKIIGIWDFDGNTKYEFSENNIGYLKVPIGDYKFYYFLDNNKISIDFENEGSEDTIYEYEIKDNKLTLKNANGVFEFNKVGE